jgi:carboxylesterase
MTARTLEPFDPAVVAPWHLGDGARGALLIHGFASTPPELRRLGEHLAARGWRCSGPALPGHAATPEALEATTWRDWAGAAQSALDELAAECDEVVVAGQSMGGTIALHLAATDLRVRAVATLAAPVRLSGIAQHLLPLFVATVRWYYPGDDIDLWHTDAIEELYSYGRRATRSIRELKRLTNVVRDELAQIRCPVLVLHGERDRTIDPRNAAEIESRLVSSAAVARRTFPRSGHALSVDVDREAVNAAVSDWFDQYSSAHAARGSSRLVRAAG